MLVPVPVLKPGKGRHRREEARHAGPGSLCRAYEQIAGNHIGLKQALYLAREVARPGYKRAAGQDQREVHGCKSSSQPYLRGKCRFW